MSDGSNDRSSDGAGEVIGGTVSTGNPGRPLLPVVPGQSQTVTGQGTWLAQTDPELENITASQTLTPGYYWTAKSDRGSNVKAGETLLLLEVIEFEEKVHSVKVLLHPRRGNGSVTFLVQDFIDTFDPCYEADSIRASEQQAVLDRVAALQDELVRTQSDQTLMIEAIRDTVEKDLAEQDREAQVSRERERAGTNEKSRSLDKLHRRAARRSSAAGNPLVVARVGSGSRLSQMIEGGVNSAGVAELRQAADRQIVIAKAQAGWLTSKTEDISRALKELAPYAAEKAQLALARSSDAVKLSEKLRRGIESLDLYTGDGVEVFDVCTGADAPTSEPLMLVQAKRFMDEELAAYADVTSAFDWRDKEQFFREIESNDLLLNQVFPSERCVVSMAVTRHTRHYDNPFQAVMENLRNQAVFLLVRNGANVSVVYSATPSHEAAHRLFPTEDELGAVFQGVDGEKITIRDVDFGKHTKAFDDLALHYRRFLILLCGLDHRMKLFGDFYPAAEGTSFMSRSFQERFMRFYADAEPGHLLTDRKIPWVDDWITEKNAMAQPGSRVYVGRSDSLRASSPEVARRSDLRFMDWQFKEQQVVLREGTRLYLSLATKDGYRGTDPGPNVKCYLDSVTSSHEESNSPWWICVDAVKADEVDYFIHSRRNRAMGVGYLRLFRRMEQALRLEEASEAPARAYLLEQATTYGGMPEPVALPAVDTAVRMWRAARRGVAMPTTEDLSALNEVLDLVTPEGFVPPAAQGLLDAYVDALSLNSSALSDDGPSDLADGSSAAGVLKALSRSPLLITRSGKNRYVIYTTTNELDREPYPSVLDWRWVRRVVLEPTKTFRSLKEVSEGLVWLGRTLPAAETEIRRWEGDAGISAWLNKEPEPIRLKKYAELKSNLSDAAEWSPVLRAGPGAGMPEDLFDRLLSSCAKRHAQNRTNSTAYLMMGIPVGVISKGRVLSTVYFTARAEKVLHVYGNEEQKQRVFDMLRRAHWRETNIRKYLSDSEHTTPWWLVHTTELIDIRHDEAVKDGISGMKNDDYWMSVRVEGNHKRSRGSEKTPGKKGDGKPRTYPSRATLSLNRAFDELAGVGPILRRIHFKNAVSRTRGSWASIPSSVSSLYRHNPTPEEALSYKRAKADFNRRTREAPYVPRERCNLSALVWDAAQNRSIANNHFKAPLLPPKASPVEAKLEEVVDEIADGMSLAGASVTADIAVADDVAADGSSPVCERPRG